MKTSRKIRPLLLPGIVLGIAAISLIGLTFLKAEAAATRIGTPSSGITARSIVDTYQNFTIVDTGQTAPQAGYVSSFEYYAQATGAIRFVITDSSNQVTWVSDYINVVTTGYHTYTPSSAAQVQAGNRIGYYTAYAGVIPFDDGTTSSVIWTPNGNGEPTTGLGLTIEGGGSRTYSMGATITDSAPPTNISQCKNGGWKTQTRGDGSTFKNQGDCIQYVNTGK